MIYLILSLLLALVGAAGGGTAISPGPNPDTRDSVIMGTDEAELLRVQTKMTSFVV